MDTLKLAIELVAFAADVDIDDISRISFDADDMTCTVTTIRERDKYDVADVVYARTDTVLALNL